MQALVLEKFYALQRDFSNLTYSFQHSVGPPNPLAVMPEYPEYPRLLVRAWLATYPPGPNPHARTHARTAV